MTKHADVLKAALEKKHAAAHPDAADSQAGKAKKPGKMGGPPVSKPMKKVTGRGR